MELLIVLAIAAILVTASVSLFGRSKSVIQRQNAARQFKNYLERARFDSIKRRASVPAQMASLQILNSSRFTVTLDGNQNGILDLPGETMTLDLSTAGSTSITGNNFAYPITIRFDQRGQIEVINGDGIAITPLFYFCDTSCTTTTANASNSNIIYLSPTGTVAMMRGGDVVPTFANPAVTAIATNSSVNPRLAVFDPASVPATPTPTPVPTPTPAPTPTPTPGPLGTPSPTPTPPACFSGQYVSSGCICLLPMWLRSNGRCR